MKFRPLAFDYHVEAMERLLEQKEQRQNETLWIVPVPPINTTGGGIDDSDGDDDVNGANAKASPPLAVDSQQQQQEKGISPASPNEGNIKESVEVLVVDDDAVSDYSAATNNKPNQNPPTPLDLVVSFSTNQNVAHVHSLNTPATSKRASIRTVAVITTHKKTVTSEIGGCAENEIFEQKQKQEDEENEVTFPNQLFKNASVQTSSENALIPTTVSITNHKVRSPNQNCADGSRIQDEPLDFKHDDIETKLTEQGNESFRPSLLSQAHPSKKCDDDVIISDASATDFEENLASPKTSSSNKNIIIPLESLLFLTPVRPPQHQKPPGLQTQQKTIFVSDLYSCSPWLLRLLSTIRRNKNTRRLANAPCQNPYYMAFPRALRIVHPVRPAWVEAMLWSFHQQIFHEKHFPHRPARLLSHRDASACDPHGSFGPWKIESQKERRFVLLQDKGSAVTSTERTEDDDVELCAVNKSESPPPLKTSDVQPRCEIVEQPQMEPQKNELQSEQIPVVAVQTILKTKEMTVEGQLTPTLSPLDKQAMHPAKRQKKHQSVLPADVDWLRRVPSYHSLSSDSTENRSHNRRDLVKRKGSFKTAHPSPSQCKGPRLRLLSITPIRTEQPKFQQQKSEEEHDPIKKQKLFQHPQIFNDRQYEAFLMKDDSMKQKRNPALSEEAFLQHTNSPPDSGGNKDTPKVIDKEPPALKSQPSLRLSLTKTSPNLPLTEEKQTEAQQDIPIAAEQIATQLQQPRSSEMKHFPAVSNSIDKDEEAKVLSKAEKKRLKKERKAAKKKEKKERKREKKRKRESNKEDSDEIIFLGVRQSPVPPHPTNPINVHLPKSNKQTPAVMKVELPREPIHERHSSKPRTASVQSQAARNSGYPPTVVGKTHAASRVATGHPRGIISRPAVPISTAPSIKPDITRPVITTRNYVSKNQGQPTQKKSIAPPSHNPILPPCSKYSNMAPIQVLCSESFLEGWSQAVVELSSGRWVQSLLRETHKKISNPLPDSHVLGRKFVFCDSLACDICEISVELPNQRGIIVQSVKPRDGALKNFTMEMVQKAASERYRELHCILVLVAEPSPSQANELVQLQTGVTGDLCSSQVFFSFVTASSLSAMLARVILGSLPKNKQAKNYQVLLANSEIVTRVNFLVHLLPSLSVEEAFSVITENGNPRLQMQKILSSETERRMFCKAVRPGAMAQLTYLLAANLSSDGMP